MMPLGPKMGWPQGGHMFFIGLYREKHEKYYCLKPQGLDLKPHLINLYQVCSNYTPRAKNGPVQEVTCFSQAYIGKA